MKKKSLESQKMNDRAFCEHQEKLEKARKEKIKERRQGRKPSKRKKW